MAKEYIQINEDNQGGLIAISTHVLESIATYALQEGEGIHLASGAFQDALTCKIVDNKLNIHAKVRLDYGYNVASTCEDAQLRIRQAIQQSTEIPCSEVSIEVVGFIME